MIGLNGRSFVPMLSGFGLRYSRYYGFEDNTEQKRKAADNFYSSADDPVRRGCRFLYC